GAGALSMLSGNALAFWFERRLGTVEGFRQFCMACAIGIIPGLNLWLINLVGWRWTYVIIGLGIWSFMIPAMVWLWRDRPEHMGQFKDGLPPRLADDEQPVETEADEQR